MTSVPVTATPGTRRPRRRAVVGTAVLVVAEVVLYARYARLGAELHWWLHGLVGVGLGAAVVAATVAARARSARAPVPPAALVAAVAVGHVVSALPDVLFVASDVLHVPWMDVFALHISIHFVPWPLPTTYALAAIGLLAWAAASSGAQRTAVALVAAEVVVLVVALGVRAPIPRTLEDVRAAEQLAHTWPLAVLR